MRTRASGWRSESARSSTPLDCSPGGQAAALLLRVHALVGEPERLVGLGRLVGQRDRPYAAEIVEALAVLAQRALGARDHELGLRAVVAHDDAELVAAHPVGVAAPRDEAREVVAEPAEQRVAGGVAERVVVLLEAVQVEERRDVALVRAPEQLLEVVEAAAGGCRAR